jgi:sugar O-acyltransferase (sialic acid O-acetyltransferase NeuD family)
VKPLFLIGAGGHCRSCIDVIEAEGKYKITGIIEQTGSNSESVLGYQILGNDNDLSELVKECSTALITVGQIKNADMRVKLFQQLRGIGFELATIISPRAYVSKNATLGVGTIVMHDALINTGAIIGNNCILNTKSLVEHDAIVEDHCHISTSSVVNGGAIIREQTFIGSNSMVKEYITIGEHSVIGGGLRLVRDLPEKKWLKNNKNLSEKND